MTDHLKEQTTKALEAVEEGTRQFEKTLNSPSLPDIILTAVEYARAQPPSTPVYPPGYGKSSVLFEPIPVKVTRSAEEAMKKLLKPEHFQAWLKGREIDLKVTEAINKSNAELLAKTNALHDAAAARRAQAKTVDPLVEACKNGIFIITVAEGRIVSAYPYYLNRPRKNFLARVWDRVVRFVRKFFTGPSKAQNLDDEDDEDY
jgi:hypothetical protein